MAVQQKGANGLIAEYSACERLAERLAEANRLAGSDSAHFAALRLAAEERVGNELSQPLIQRARRQGGAIGDYIFNALERQPSDLGLEIDAVECSIANIEVRHVGNNTHGRVPEDIVLTIRPADSQEVSLPISIKAYKSGTVSLGSKSATATLSRLFLNKDRVSKDEFINHFGPPGEEFHRALDLFNATQKEYYDSDASREFLDEYERRKGTRKVNNPRRRKEVGEYFRDKYGYLSEHKFAELFCRIFNESVAATEHEVGSQPDFLFQLRFILANPEVLALNAVAETVDSEVFVDSSLSNPTYRNLNSVLQPGLRMRLMHKEGSSIAGVAITRGDQSCEQLSLAVWKDATIQFKLHA